MRSIFVTIILGALALWIGIPTIFFLIGLVQCFHQWGWL